jgi:hypothetical protein
MARLGHILLATGFPAKDAADFSAGPRASSKTAKTTR